MMMSRYWLFSRIKLQNQLTVDSKHNLTGIVILIMHVKDLCAYITYIMCLYYISIIIIAKREYVLRVTEYLNENTHCPLATRDFKFRYSLTLMH